MIFSDKTFMKMSDIYSPNSIVVPNNSQRSVLICSKLHFAPVSPFTVKEGRDSGQKPHHPSFADDNDSVGGLPNRF